MAFQEQVKEERSVVRLPYADLDRRVRVLEERERDPIALIRERFGKPS